MYGSRGTVTFLFGVEVQAVDLNGAESLLKSRLTYFGFAQYVVVTETQRRTTESIAFNVKSLPMIYDIVCAIWYAYRLPAERKSNDHENSIANPLLSKGLGRYHGMSEPPEMPEPPATAPAARGLQHELQGPDWDVPEPPEDLQRLPPDDLQTILQGPGWEQPMDHSYVEIFA
ncbi:hypothetical protein P3T76_011183 [Phytophthora citrophthora]|uniref:Uncharacterized protein n=1 Tax=Phytophthora citrophthora TaxID=4793 RepID=A0AAD9GA31_9STRA|nr:hypothetical protein P3T76_011183 [Phytophthora citrophthora]